MIWYNKEMDCWARRVLTVLFFLSVFLVFFQAPVDTDLGWHLRYGNYFLSHGRPLMENTISVLMAGWRWPNSYILYQPLVAFVYNVFGFWGLSALNGLLFTVTFYFIYLFFDRSLLKTVVTFFIFLLGGWSILRHGLRSQMMAFFFLAVLFYLLKHQISWWRRALLIFGLFALWGNFHGSFPLGIVVVVLWELFKFIDAKKAGEIWHFCIYGLAALCGPLLNPYGVGNYRNVLYHFQTPLRDLIAEWVPATGVPGTVSVTIFLIYLVFLAGRRAWRANFFWLVLGGFVLFMALGAQRNLPLYSLVQGIGLAFLLKTEGKRIFVGGLIIGFFGLSLGIVLPRTIRLNSYWVNYCDEGIMRYPRRAVAFAREQGLEGRVFNTYGWGGFLAWQMPETKIFVDGRMPAWPHPSGKSPYTIFLEILQARPGYQESLKRYKIDWLLIREGTFLDLALNQEKDSAWDEVYRDDLAVIYLLKEHI